MYNVNYPWTYGPRVIISDRVIIVNLNLTLKPLKNKQANKLINTSEKHI